MHLYTAVDIGNIYRKYFANTLYTAKKTNKINVKYLNGFMPVNRIIYETVHKLYD